MAGPVYQFGDFRLDCGRFELSRRGHSIPVERKPLELLVLLAERRGQLVTRAEIAERLWDPEVFVDTEHGINTAIRKIRQTLRDDSGEPRFVQTVMGKGYRFVAPVEVRPGQPEANPQLPEAFNGNGVTATSGDPPQAPVVGPDNSVLDDSVRHEIQPKRQRKRWLWTAAAGVLVLAVAAVAIWRFIAERRLNATADIHSLAVLPLDNLSGDPRQEYFADGMTDELTTMLAKDSTLRIVSRTSAMQYKGARRPLPEIARALGVDAIVEGSVERSGDRVHMTLQLIRGPSDTHIWAENYERDADDAALPDEAAQAIAKRLHRSAPTVAAAKYVNPAAHDAYLQGKYLWFSDNRLLESGKYFQKAIDLQPDYALGWAWLANYYGAGTVGGMLDPRKSLEPLEAAAKRAMQLDPNLAESHQALAGAYFFHRWDYAGADRELLRAISLDPYDAELYHLRAKLLSILNRHAEAIESEKKGMEIDPFERPWGLVHTYTSARQYDAAIQDGQLRLKDYPNDTTLLYLMTEAYRRNGMYREAVETWAKWHVLTGDPQSAANLRRAYQKGGFPGFLRWELGWRTEQAKTQYVSPVELASYYGQLKEREGTMKLLEEGYQQRSPDLLWIQTDPAFDFLHSDPRYRALVQKIGLPPAY